MRVRRESSGELINLTAALGRGGEAEVFAFQDRAGRSFAAKVYYKQEASRAGKLAAMLGSPPDDPMARHGHASIAWPEDLLLAADGSGTVVGFLMARLPADVLPIGDYSNPRERLSKVPLFTFRYLMRMCRNVAAAVNAVHARGYVLGDVNESNMLVTQTALATLVDTDSFQVRESSTGLVHRCTVGKAEFTPPELHGLKFADVDRTVEHDRFGLAVLFFQALMEGTHPFMGRLVGPGDPKLPAECIRAGIFPYSNSSRGAYEPAPSAPPFGHLDPRVQALFTQCFVSGHRSPASRPSAAAWLKVLAEAESRLVACAVNSQHWYGGHLQVCPWCERRQELFGLDPFPPAHSSSGQIPLPPISSSPSTGASASVPRPTLTSRPALPPRPTPTTVPFATPTSAAPQPTRPRLIYSRTPSARRRWPAARSTAVRIVTRVVPRVLGALAVLALLIVVGRKVMQFAGDTLEDRKLSQSLAAATVAAPFENSLGMRFVPVPGTKVLFSIWETRRRDYEAYASWAAAHPAPSTGLIASIRELYQICVANVIDPEFSVYFIAKTGFTAKNFGELDLSRPNGAALKMIRALSSYDKLSALEGVTLERMQMIARLSAMTDEQILASWGSDPAVDDSWRKPVEMFRKFTLPTGENQPVVNVSWSDARRFARWLTTLEVEAHRIAHDACYRLPSDQEWSRAVGIGDREGRLQALRISAGGSDVRLQPRTLSAAIQPGKDPWAYPWGPDWPPMRGSENLPDMSYERAFPQSGYSIVNGYNDGYAATAPVGSFRPNQLGLYDLGGNVREVTDDFFDEALDTRVMRGGAWEGTGTFMRGAWVNDEQQLLLSSIRLDTGSGAREIDQGFRLVLAMEGGTEGCP